MLTFVYAHHVTPAVLSLSEEIKGQDPDDHEDEIEEVWDVSDLCYRSERHPPALRTLKPLWESFSLPVKTKVVEAPQWMKDSI